MTGRVLLTIGITFAMLSSNGQESSSARDNRVHTEMRNVIYHFTDSISVHIAYLEGDLVPVGKPGIPVFDDANSFDLAVRSAEISITADALSNALNQYAFAVPDAPIKGIRVSTRGGKLKINGQGRLSSIAIRGNEIVQQYGTASVPSHKMTGNYMSYRGAQLRFGKLTMSDTDLTLIDMNPEDPFDFYLPHYKDQLVAGYTKTTPTFGLRSYFRDYNKLRPMRKSRTSKQDISRGTSAAASP